MMESTLTAICPLDGRYASKLSSLNKTVSEWGLLYYRVFVEIRWFMHLADTPSITHIPALSASAKQFLEDIIAHFNDEAAARIKTIEKTTNHDVKAVEYFLKERMATHPELSSLVEGIHFACTSEDINNLAYGIMLSDTKTQHILPKLNAVIETLQTLAHTHADVAMLSRTHGQPASPTTMGKELAVFAHRLMRQKNQLQSCMMLGKMNGAVGNYNAHYVAYPSVNWPELAQSFVVSLGLEWNPYTTQIEPHDCIAEFAHILMRIDTILIDLCRDIWGYISLNYFQQKRKEEEVGSSTMPHKINPIDFENAEGNLGMAHSLLQHLAHKLPISRFQRDLTDSTTLRNTGLAIGYGQLAMESLLVGLNKLILNPSAIHRDLEGAWEVLGEAIQTVLRQYHVPNAYEQLKTLTRGKKLDAQTLQAFIDTLSLPTAVKQQLQQLTPQTYIGNASQQAKEIV